MTERLNIDTFWDLIKEHRIEIPLIQRDYAQGRNDTKAIQIRESFVRALVGCLKNNTSLHLEFIYGKIEGKQDKTRKNKQAVADLLRSVAKYSDHLDLEISYTVAAKGSSLNGGPESWFIPLDGQQRLTTLFLLHWYISSRLDNHFPEILGRFSYKIRRSSKAFCKALVSSNFRARPVYNLSEKIRDSSWFYRNWYKDPYSARDVNSS
jgi:RNAse (barnase) inhibitor barstar